MQIGHVPFDVTRCAEHVHGVGQAMMPDGGAFVMSAMAPTRAELADKLLGLVTDGQELARIVEDLPVAAYLVFGISLVDGGARVQAPDDETRTEIARLLDGFVSGDMNNGDPHDPLIAFANGALSMMAPEVDLRTRKRAEGYYAEVVRQGLARSLSLPMLQARANLRGA